MEEGCGGKGKKYGIGILVRQCFFKRGEVFFFMLRASECIFGNKRFALRFFGTGVAGCAKTSLLGNEERKKRTSFRAVVGWLCVLGWRGTGVCPQDACPAPLQEQDVVHELRAASSSIYPA